MREYVVRTVYNRGKLTLESFNNIFKTHLLIPTRISVNIYEIMNKLNLSKL